MSPAPGCCITASADELVTMALRGINELVVDVCLLGDLLTPEQRHHIIGHLTSARGALLTPPVRPAGAGP